MRTLTVSRASAAFLRRGHPWVRRDRDTRGLDAVRPGEPVTLVDQRGTRLASALADPQQAICARVYHRRPDRRFDPAAAVARAWDRRAALHAARDTDCYRLVHGEADFLPALRVERYAGVLVVVLRAPCMLPHCTAVCATLHAHAPRARIVIREHHDDLRRRTVRTRAWDGAAVDPDARVLGHELGVAVHCTPFAGLATGLYVDQRATRAALRAGSAGGRVLNLFAYTGVFSVSLLAAGAAHATDVDLAAPALALAADNARANGVADRHRPVQAPVATFLAQDRERYDLIIVDPPTAAQGGGGWVVRRDYPDVLSALAPRLAPGGRVLAACNTLGRRFDLHGAVTRALDTAVPLAAPPIGDDLPQLRGFPEGRPFDLVYVALP